MLRKKVGMAASYRIESRFWNLNSIFWWWLLGSALNNTQHMYVGTHYIQHIYTIWPLCKLEFCKSYKIVIVQIRTERKMAMRNYYLNPCPRWTEINVSATDRVQIVSYCIHMYMCRMKRIQSTEHSICCSRTSAVCSSLHALNPTAYTLHPQFILFIFIHLIFRTTRLSSVGVVIPLIRIEGKWFFIALLIFYPFGFPSDGLHSFHRALSSIFCKVS